MENPNHKWRYLAGKIIYFYGPFSIAMLNNQRVYVHLVQWNCTSKYRIVEYEELSIAMRFRMEGWISQPGSTSELISADVGAHQICAIHYQFTNTVGIQSHLNTIQYNLWSVWFLLLKLLVMLLNTLLVKSRGWQMSWLNFTQLLGLFHLQQILENYISSAKYLQNPASDIYQPQLNLG